MASSAVGMVTEIFQYIPAVSLCSVQPSRNLLEYFEAIVHIHFGHINSIISTSV